jgi:hypothetical protein
MSATDQPSEEELRAAYEAELKQIRVEQIVLEQVVTLVNLGMRKTGLAPGTEDERDPDQVRIAIEGVRALTPLLEQVAPQQVQPIREALSQLQLAYVRLGGPQEAVPPGPADSGPGSTPPPTRGPGPGQAPTEPPAPSDPGEPGEPGPAQRSGRLWVPGQ